MPDLRVINLLSYFNLLFLKVFLHILIVCYIFIVFFNLISLKIIAYSERFLKEL
jgi:hypothetical protein